MTKFKEIERKMERLPDSLNITDALIHEDKKLIDYIISKEYEYEFDVSEVENAISEGDWDDKVLKWINSFLYSKSGSGSDEE